MADVVVPQTPAADKDKQTVAALPSESSALSDVNNTVIENLGAHALVAASGVPDATKPEVGATSARTDELVTRINANAENAAKTGVSGYDAAREQVVNNMATIERLTPPSQTDILTPIRGGRGGRRASSSGIGNGEDRHVMIKMEDGATQGTPGSAGRGRGRGRGGGRPRGRGRGGGRGGKRKREDDDEDASDSSEEVTPIATTTKSGRSVQKPTNFVPPPPSPTAKTKRKRPFTNRRNPESAVCKVCLRGTSPTSNQVVFCDGCNAPYHQWCHKPPIPTVVTEEVDKEWFCAECESERVVPVPETDVANFVGATGLSAEERKQYFSRLPPGMLVTLLTKATSLHPDLPVFTPEFIARKQNGTMLPPAQPPSQSTSNNHRNTTFHPDDLNYPPETHPSRYPRPGQGLMSTLPPDNESEVTDFLVDPNDNANGVFTHVYKTGNAEGGAPS